VLVEMGEARHGERLGGGAPSVNSRLSARDRRKAATTTASAAKRAPAQNGKIQQTWHGGNRGHRRQTRRSVRLGRLVAERAPSDAIRRGRREIQEGRTIMTTTSSQPARRGKIAGAAPRGHKVDMKLEVIVIPVAEVGRSKDFYARLGWRLDADFAAPDGSYRVIQFTPPGSGCSVIFGKNVTAAAPGSAQGLYLIVSDVEAARNDLIGRGVEVSEAFHDAGGVYAGPDEPYLFGRLRVRGRDPEQRTYRSFASFSDPDGNGWLFQEITARLPGRVSADATTFASTADLAGALRRAEAAHGVYEKTLGKRDENRPDWYADHMVKEQAGT
jgi:catechol 2,3-dioxygenase-like lactoylglutathione lyase family enzyme